MTGNQVRESFLEFFRSRGHDIVPSASLVPPGDPTLLFTNAGMVQFKTGLPRRGEAARTRAPRTRRSACDSAASTTTSKRSAATPITTRSSRCSATGRSATTTRRKRSRWAWELLTEVWKLPKTGPLGDGLQDRRRGRGTGGARPPTSGATEILRFGEKDNFWEMGETGPCGPCSEIHIDRGPDACDTRHGSPATSARSTRAAPATSSSGTWSSSSTTATRDGNARRAAGQARRHRHGTRARHGGAAGRASATTTPISCADVIAFTEESVAPSATARAARSTSRSASSPITVALSRS